MWRVVTVEGFDEWFLSLSDKEQVDVLAGVKLIEVSGPNLGRPYVDSLVETRNVKNLKELRVQHQGRPYRVMFAFDPLRRAVMLCGGDKTGDKRFYKRMLPIAEREFSKHLAELTRETVR